MLNVEALVKKNAIHKNIRGKPKNQKKDNAPGVE